MMKYNRKAFLSDNPEETGSICGRAKIDGGYCTLEAELRIYDCNRSVTLDFDCFDLSEIPERVAKADLLIEEITKFRDALISLKPNTHFYY